MALIPFLALSLLFSEAAGKNLTEVRISGKAIIADTLTSMAEVVGCPGYILPVS